MPTHRTANLYFLVEKYLKTTVFGMTGHAPDYAMLMVGHELTLDLTLIVHRS